MRTEFLAWSDEMYQRVRDLAEITGYYTPPNILKISDPKALAAQRWWMPRAITHALRTYEKIIERQCEGQIVAFLDPEEITHLNEIRSERGDEKVGCMKRLIAEGMEEKAVDYFDRN